MNFADIFWSLIVFYFWFMIIWIFIRIFADIFHRNDLSGGAKAVWILALIFLPFLGALIYMIMRKPTEQDRQEIQQVQEMQRRAAGYSAADEIAKLQQLKDSGAITQQEFDAQKAKALA